MLNFNPTASVYDSFVTSKETLFIELIKLNTSTSTFSTQTVVSSKQLVLGSIEYTLSQLLVIHIKLAMHRILSWTLF